VTGQLIAIFLITLVAGLLLVPLARQVAIRVDLIDRPRPGELQRWPVARGGGYALILAFAIGVGSSLLLMERPDEEMSRLIGFTAGLVVILPIAILDDWLRLGPRPQFIGQIAAAVLPLPFGLLITDVSSPLGLIPLPLLIGIPFTILWVVGMINTINWLDTMDGLASGVAAIAALVLLARTIDLGQHSVAVLPLALLAACLAFLPYNFNPARVFMGTSGSMFLGYALATLAIFGGAKIATALMVLGIPILDTALVIAQRLLAGRSPFQGGGGEHLVHRLAKRGWGVRRIALTLYAGCLAFGVGGLSFSGPLKAWIFGAAGVLVLILIALLASRTRPERTPAAR
jgi:UDP-GlcNAc:undecaprenyl-phosphate GlcNAc-1-phosphate transferase